MGTNGGGGNGGMAPQEAFSRTAGFALEDLRRLTDEIGAGEHAAVVLVEHVWAAHLRETVREAGGRLLGQGFLTPEVVMIVGAEIQARADAQAALELAEAARGSALLDALATIAAREQRLAGGAGCVPRRRSCACSCSRGSSHGPEAGAAVDALATAGVLEAAFVEAAIAEAEDALGGDD